VAAAAPKKPDVAAALHRIGAAFRRYT